MLINIVAQETGWVISRLIKSLAAVMNDVAVVTINSLRPDADVYLYVFQRAFKKKTNKIDVVWFSHDMANKFPQIGKDADHCIAMCDIYANVLPKDKTTVVHFAPDSQFCTKEIIFGCVGRKYFKRKTFKLIPQLRQELGAKILFTNGKLAWEDLPAFYNSIDYLLILATKEGGPMPVVEALAAGVPVIAPNVGWCWEYPVIRYNDTNELKQIIKKLTQPLSWDAVAKQVYDICYSLYTKNKM